MRRGNAYYPPLLAYHHIQGGFHLDVNHIPFPRFQSQMLALQKLGYRAVGLDRLISHPAADGEFGILFEDCYDDLAGAPLNFLHEIGFTATLFVISDFIGQTNQWEASIIKKRHITLADLRDAVDKGFTIGSHTSTHRDLTLLPHGEMVQELRKSKEHLEKLFSTEIKYLSYPFGRFNRRVLDAMRECGYKAGFTINTPHCYTGDCRQIPTSGVYRFDSVQNVCTKVERGRGLWVEQVKGKLINRFAEGTVLVKGLLNHG